MMQRVRLRLHTEELDEMDFAGTVCFRNLCLQKWTLGSMLMRAIFLTGDMV
jgi:hypothetical protein